MRETSSFIDSPIHRLPPMVKMLGTLALMLTVLLGSARQPWVLPAVAAVVLALVLAARLPWRYWFVRLLLLEPLVIGVAVLWLLQPGGWRIFLWLVARSTVSVLALLVMAGTTPPHEQIAVLRTLRVPAPLVTTIALMQRYLHVLMEESLRMRRARGARTFTDSRRRVWSNLATVIGQLFLRSVDRAERVFAAMSARGWQ